MDSVNLVEVKINSYGRKSYHFISYYRNKEEAEYGKTKYQKLFPDIRLEVI